MSGFGTAPAKAAFAAATRRLAAQEPGFVLDLHEDDGCAHRGRLFQVRMSAAKARASARHAAWQSGGTVGN